MFYVFGLCLRCLVCVLGVWSVFEVFGVCFRCLVCVLGVWCVF